MKMADLGVPPAVRKPPEMTCPKAATAVGTFEPAAPGRPTSKMSVTTFGI